MATRSRNRLAHSEPPPDGVTLTQEEFDALSDAANTTRALMHANPELEDEGEPETATDRVAAMLAGIGDDPESRAIVKLYKVTGPNKFAFADEYEIPVFEAGGIKMVREQWGAGEYQIRLYATKPGSKIFAVRAKENVTILAPLVPLPNSNVAPAGQSGLDSVLRALMENQKTMMEAITNRPQSDPKKDMKEMLEMMALMKGAFGGGNQGSSLADQLALIRQLKEVSEEFGGGGESKEPSLMEMAGSVMKMVSSAPRAAPAVPAPPQPVRLVSHNPAPEMQAQPEAPQTPETEGENPVSMFDITLLQKTLSKLIKSAEANGDVQESAEVLADAFDLLENQDAALTMLESPMWWEVLQKINPETAPHQAWLTQVRDNTLIIFADGDDAPAGDELPNASAG